MKQIMKLFVVLTALLLMLSTTVMMVNAGNGPFGSNGNPDKPEDKKDKGKGGSTTADQGDLYGDLVKIVREPVNGVPILDENSCEILINASGGDPIYMIYDADSRSCTIPEGAAIVEVGLGRSYPRIA